MKVEIELLQKYEAYSNDRKKFQFVLDSEAPATIQERSDVGDYSIIELDEESLEELRVALNLMKTVKEG